ncbi:hypothetical protein [Phocaeicola sp.]|uniref:hypothetical protein n=1 Tax=Phocaeicola sp. TaxID=2773926 RepID=UPI003AB3913D
MKKPNLTLSRQRWFGYVYSGGLSYANRQDETKLAQMKEKSIRHAHLLVEKLKDL